MAQGGQDNLDRLRQLSRTHRFLRVRARLLVSVAVGLFTLLLLPAQLHWSTRTLEVVVRDRRDGDAPPVGERIAIIRRLAHDIGIDDGLGGHALTLRFRRLGRG